MRLLSMRRMLPNPLKIVVLVALIGMMAGAATEMEAQLAPSPDASPVSNAPPPKPEDENPVLTLKVDVNLVNLYFTVKDKSGTLVPHLTKENCSVDEDKTAQTLKHFVAETNQPLTLGILIDTSGSQQRVLPLEKEFGAQFLNRILRKTDQAFVANFDVNVDLLQDFSNSPRELERGMDKAEINAGVSFGSGPVGGANKGTVLYDAVYQASTSKLGGETGRKAIIILTDGQDEGSDHKIAEAIAAAQKSNVIIYGILIADRGQYGGFGLGYSGDFSLKKMSDETGGRMINVGNNGNKLQAAFSQIEDELRTQYVASYTPTNAKIDGSYRKIGVDCKSDKGDKLNVQVRKGYYALAAEE